VINRHGRQVQGGAVIYREGNPAQEVFIIQDGTVRLHKEVSGEELCLAIVGPGDFFGELSVIENQVHSTTATAMTDAVIVTLDRALFQKILSENTEIGTRLIRALCHRLREANNRTLAVLSRDDEGRVADALISLDRTAAVGDQSNGVMDAWLVASRAGLVQLRVDAIINHLVMLDLVCKNGAGRLTIVSREALEDFIEYSGMKKRYDPLSPDELAQIAGMSIPEAQQLTERVIRRRLADRHDKELGSGLLTPLQRYLQLKLRFEFSGSSDRTAVVTGENDHEGAL
jgi:cAMP-binding proteins - catabolite gene activator and regulatory subunit of cAMP-dependent protein kinases